MPCADVDEERERAADDKLALPNELRVAVPKLPPDTLDLIEQDAVALDQLLETLRHGPQSACGAVEHH